MREMHKTRQFHVWVECPTCGSRMKVEETAVDMFGCDRMIHCGFEGCADYQIPWRFNRNTGWGQQT